MSSEIINEPCTCRGAVAKLTIAELYQMLVELDAGRGQEADVRPRSV